jgi:hypothetical protein
MAEEEKIKTLRAILADVKIEGLDLASLPLVELEKINGYHKDYNVLYNQTNPIPIGLAPNIAYIEKRNAYVNQKLTERLANDKKSLETQLQNGTRTETTI